MTRKNEKLLGHHFFVSSFTRNYVAFFLPSNRKKTIFLGKMKIAKNKNKNHLGFDRIPNKLHIELSFIDPPVHVTTLT